MSQQYNQVRETINETLDWREQFKRRPVPFVAGAAGLGLLLGYGLGGAFSGGESDDELDRPTRNRRDELDEDDDDVRASISASNLGAAIAPTRSFASTPITGAPGGASGFDHSADSFDEDFSSSSSARGFGGFDAPSASAHTRQVESRPVYAAAAASAPLQGFAGGGAATDDLETEDSFAASSVAEADKPGLMQRIQESGVIDKFKESKAYDKLQQELGTLGDRVIEELSTTARNVVVPALLSKLKDMIGIDLGTQREVAQRSRAEHETAKTRAQAEAAAPGGTSASGASA